jgi:hypothetical protein
MTTRTPKITDARIKSIQRGARWAFDEYEKALTVYGPDSPQASAAHDDWQEAIDGGTGLASDPLFRAIILCGV